jgi:hypothetical protein
VRRGAEPNAEPKDEPGCPTQSPQGHPANAAQPPITSAADHLGGDLLAQPVIPRNSTPQKEEKDSVAAQGQQTLNDRAFAAARRHESESVG